MGEVMKALLFLASFPALAIVATYALQGLKALFPALKDKAAVIASVMIAALVSVVTNLLLARGVVIPAWLEQLWPTGVWLISQIWYTFVVKKGAVAPASKPKVEPPSWEGGQQG